MSILMAFCINIQIHMPRILLLLLWEIFLADNVKHINLNVIVFKVLKGREECFLKTDHITFTIRLQFLLIKFQRKVKR